MMVARRRSGKRRPRKNDEDEGLSMSVPLEFDEAEEDKNAVEEVEMYDHISAVGLLDEEQEEMDRRIKEEREKAASVVKGRGTKAERRRKRRG